MTSAPLGRFYVLNLGINRLNADNQAFNYMESLCESDPYKGWTKILFQPEHNLVPSDRWIAKGDSVYSIVYKVPEKCANIAGYKEAYKSAFQAIRENVAETNTPAHLLMVGADYEVCEATAYMNGYGLENLAIGVHITELTQIKGKSEGIGRLKKLIRDPNRMKLFSDRNFYQSYFFDDDRDDYLSNQTRYAKFNRLVISSPEPTVSKEILERIGCRSDDRKLTCLDSRESVFPEIDNPDDKIIITFVDRVNPALREGNCYSIYSEQLKRLKMSGQIVNPESEGNREFIDALVTTSDEYKESLADVSVPVKVSYYLGNSSIDTERVAIAFQRTDIGIVNGLLDRYYDNEMDIFRGQIQRPSTVSLENMAKAIALSDIVVIRPGVNESSCVEASIARMAGVPVISGMGNTLTASNLNGLSTVPWFTLSEEFLEDYTRLVVKIQMITERLLEAIAQGKNQQWEGCSYDILSYDPTNKNSTEAAGISGVYTLNALQISSHLNVYMQKTKYLSFIQSFIVKNTHKGTIEFDAGSFDTMALILEVVEHYCSQGGKDSAVLDILVFEDSHNSYVKECLLESSKEEFDGWMENICHVREDGRLHRYIVPEDNLEDILFDVEAIQALKESGDYDFYMIVFRAGQTCSDLLADESKLECLKDILKEKIVVFEGMTNKDLCDLMSYFKNSDSMGEESITLSTYSTTNGVLVFSPISDMPRFSPISGNSCPMAERWQTDDRDILLTLVISIVTNFSGRHVTQLEQIFWAVCRCIDEGVQGAFVDFNFNGYDFAGFMTMILTLDYVGADSDYLEVIALTELDEMSNNETEYMKMVAPSAKNLLEKGYPPQGIWTKESIEAYVNQVRPDFKSTAILKVVSCSKLIGLSWLGTSQVACAFVHTNTVNEADTYLIPLGHAISPNGVLLAPDLTRPHFYQEGQLHSLSDALEYPERYYGDLTSFMSNVAKEEIFCYVDDTQDENDTNLTLANSVTQLANIIQVEEVPYYSPVWKKDVPQASSACFLLMPTGDLEARTSNLKTLLDSVANSRAIILGDEKNPSDDFPVEDWKRGTVDVTTGRLIGSESVYDYICRNLDPGSYIYVIEDGVSITKEALIWACEILPQLDFKSDRCGLVCAINAIGQDSNLILVNTSTMFPAMGFFGITYEAAESIRDTIDMLKTGDITGLEPFSSRILNNSHFTEDEIYPDIYNDDGKDVANLKYTSLVNVMSDFFKRTIEILKEGKLDTLQAQTWLGLAYSNQYAIASPSTFATDHRVGLFNWRRYLLPATDDDRLLNGCEKVFQIEATSDLVRLPVRVGMVSQYREEGGILYTKNKHTTFINLVEEVFGYVHCMGAMVQKIDSVVTHEKLLFEPTRKSFPVISDLFRKSVIVEGFNEYHDGLIASWQSIERYCTSRSSHFQWVSFCIFNSKVDALIANNQFDILHRIQKIRSGLSFSATCGEVVRPDGSIVPVIHGFAPITESDQRHGAIIVDSLDYKTGESEFMAALLKMNSERLKLTVVALNPAIANSTQKYIESAGVDVIEFTGKDQETHNEYVGRMIEAIREQQYDCAFFLPEYTLSYSTTCATLARYQVASQHFVFEPNYPLSNLDDKLNVAVITTKLAHPRKDTGSMENCTERLVCLKSELSPPQVFLPVRSPEDFMSDGVMSMLSAVREYTEVAQTIVVVSRSSRITADAIQTWANITARTHSQFCLIMPKAHGYLDESNALNIVSDKVARVFRERRIEDDRIRMFNITHSSPIDLDMFATAISDASLFLDTLWTDSKHILVPYMAGVPVLTIESEIASHRTASCYNRILGFESLITRSWPEYEEKAVSILNDDDEIQSYSLMAKNLQMNLPFFSEEVAQQYANEVLGWVERFNPIVASKFAEAMNVAQQEFADTLKSRGSDEALDDDQER